MNGGGDAMSGVQYSQPLPHHERRPSLREYSSYGSAAR
jgi:hypothetical protein